MAEKKDEGKSQPQGKAKRNKNSNRRPRNNSKSRPYGTTPKQNRIERHKKEVQEMEEKALQRFTITPPLMGFPEEEIIPREFSFSWPTSPVPLKEEADMAKVVIRKGEFGWLDDARVDEIAEIVRQRKMTLDQVLSLRSALLQQKTVYGHGRLKSRSKVLLRLYNEGVNVVDLSKRFDFPPMNIFRVILAEKKWSKSRIKESLRTPSKLSKREREEFEMAEAADRVSNVDQTETHIRADLFEDILSDWFESKGVRIRRQPEMVTEQKKELGRPVKTPDILFLDLVEINGKPIAWIDAKHFYGADVDFQRKKMVKQMNRYIEEWGSGAIVYRHGFSENLFIPGCTLLDADTLDLSRLNIDSS
ncbi:MAG: TPD domain-containing protein [Candidatus Poseidoniaceae archaeon]|uniref:TPD domain-containing protein n=1 Tax=uncultured Poseidoniia archaeon TaxID=1697135 RepID=A0A1B1TG03_9ARCH|nr:hypothetical protein MG2_1749 [uncultured Candidatus Thalassoarchaea sp.]